MSISLRIRPPQTLITSTKEVMFLPKFVSVCLLVSKITLKVMDGFWWNLHNLFEVAQGTNYKVLWGDPEGISPPLPQENFNCPDIFTDFDEIFTIWWNLHKEEIINFKGNPEGIPLSLLFQENSNYPVFIEFWNIMCRQNSDYQNFIDFCPF